VITDYIGRLIEFPEALQVLTFASGRVSLVAVRAFEGGALIGKPINLKISVAGPRSDLK
jgi:trk system potassium uptake protein TrkA